MFLLILFNENTLILIKCRSLNFIGLTPIDAKTKCLKNRENIFFFIGSVIQNCAKNEYINYLINIMLIAMQNCNYEYCLLIIE